MSRTRCYMPGCRDRMMGAYAYCGPHTTAVLVGCAERADRLVERVPEGTFGRSSLVHHAGSMWVAAVVALLRWLGGVE